jgi:hypothetical protein
MIRIPAHGFDGPVDPLDFARGLAVGLLLAVLFWLGVVLWLLW